MRIKRLIQLLVLVVVAIISAGFLKTNVSAESVSIHRGNDISRFTTANGSENLPCREYYAADTGEVLYCIQHSKTGPNGHTLDLLYNMWPDNYATATRLGLKIILEHGYPYKTYGLSAVDARYATQQAIRFFMAYRGMDSTYYQDHVYQAARWLGDKGGPERTDAQLRACAANGWFPYQIDANGHTDILETAVELFIAAKNYVHYAGLPFDITSSLSTLTFTNNAGARTDIVGTLTAKTTISLSEAASFDIDVLPAGISASISGNVITFTANPSIVGSYGDTLTTIRALDRRGLKDDTSNFYVADSVMDIQRMVGVRVGADRENPVDYVRPVLSFPTDLAITSISTASTHNSGNTISVAVTVKNISKKTSPGYTLRLNSTNQTGAGLAAGSSRTHTFTYTANTYSSDTKITYNALIDPNNSINEATRYNNTGSTSTTVKAALTDLVPIIKTYSMKTGSKVYTSTFEPGERVYAELITTNTDAPTANNFSNWWSWRNNATGGLVNEHATTVSTLAGTKTHTLLKSFIPPERNASYTCAIGYEVDYNKAVPERNDTTAQNTASHTVTIKGRPNLNVTQVRTINSSRSEQNSYNPSVVAADRKVRAGIVVRNNGASTSAATTATLTLNGVTKTVNIPAIASGGTTTVYLTTAAAFDTPAPDVTTNYTVTGTVAAGQTYSGSRTGTKTISVVGRPNLNVTQVRTINSSSSEQNSYNPTVVAADRKVRAGIVVKNNGASTSAATTATLTLNGVAKTVNIPAIAAGASKTVYVATASAHDTPRPNATTNYTVTGTVAAGQTYSGSRTGTKTISVVGRPNLNVTQVRTINSSSSEQNSYNPSVVAADRKVRAGIVVKNNGASTSAATTATLTLNGVAKTVNIPAIAAGASKKVYVATASAHDTPRPNATTNYTVTGTVAAGQTYSGSRTASKTISVIGKPDLDITALSTNKTTYNPGETVTVTTNVRNKGYSTSAATTMTVKRSGTRVGSRTVPSLSAGSSWGAQTFTFTAPSTNATTTYAINVSIPSSQSPTGTTSRTVNITVRGRADLDITSLSANKSTYNAGEAIVISTNVRNKGFSTSAQSAMTFKIDGAARETRTIPALAASGSWGAQTFSFTAPAAPDNKAYTINVSIPSNQSPTGTISRTISVTVLGLPDLAVVESTAQNYFIDKDVVISALVRNYNPIAVPEAEVKLTFAGRNLIEKIPIPASGSNRAVFRIRTPVNPGEYTITIAADPDNKINETNNANNVLTQTVTVANENRVPMPDPDSPSLEQHYLAQGKTLPDLALPSSQRRHSWQEIRLENGSYVTRNYWMQIDTAFGINPDPRVAIPGKPDLIESGFGIESNAEIVITTNYDRPDKLVGPQMVYLFYPEAAYGKLPFANYADSLEILNGTKGAHNSLWHYPISPFSLTGSRLHYTPLWTPDGSYDVMAQSFYAWSPVGQMYDFKSNSVTIEGDMYDRVTVVRR